MKKRLASGLLRLLGWRLAGARPQFDRYVLIAAPHTSNWDFPLMLLFGFAFDIKIMWMAKHSLFRPPMGWVMKALGGLPIVRHENRNIVDELVDVFARGSFCRTVPHPTLHLYQHVLQISPVPLFPNTSFP